MALKYTVALIARPLPANGILSGITWFLHKPREGDRVLQDLGQVVGETSAKCVAQFQAGVRKTRVIWGGPPPVILQ